MGLRRLNVSSGGPTPACEAALGTLCYSAAKGTPCNVCCGSHQRSLMLVGCTNADISGYCAAAPPAKQEQPICGWFRNQSDPGYVCNLCKSTLWNPCQPCLDTPTVPACAACAAAVAYCPALKCW